MIESTQQKPMWDHEVIHLLFDKQPDCVVWLTPKFKSNNISPFDYEVGYCNAAASFILNAAKHQLVGSSLKSSDLIDEASRKIIWDGCMQIWDTGKSFEITHHNKITDKYFSIQKSKILKGILVIARDQTRSIRIQEEKEAQTNLLNQIIDSSTSGISVYEAIREQGTIIDFKLKLANQKAAEITAFSLDDLYIYSVKELMLIRGQTSHFETVCRVTETGEPVYMEYFSQPRNQWVAFSIKKFQDGYLLNYIDITPTKSLEKKAQDQADLLKGIFETSITGLITLQAVYDASGKIEDFQFVLLNGAAQRMLGIKDEDKSKSYLSLFPNARKNGFFDFYITALTSGTPVSKEFFYKGDGLNGWYFISVSKMNDNTLVQSIADVTRSREIN